MSVFQSLKRLGADTIIYGLGSVMQAFIGFLLFPIYTRILSQSDFGAQDLLMTFSIIAGYFLILGLDSGAARYYYDTDDPENKRTYLSSWLWLEIAGVIPVAAVLVVFAEPVCEILFGNRGLALPFRLTVLSLPFSLMIKVVNLTLRLTFRSATFSLLTGFGLLTQAATAIIFVVKYQMGISGVFLAILCANIIQAVAGLSLTAKNFSFRFSTSHLKSMLTFGLPLVPASLSIWVLNYSNRYFLSNWVGLAEVALFGAAYRINALLTIGITAFQNAWPPFAFSLLEDVPAAKKVYVRTLTAFVLGTLIAAVGLSLFAREALLLLATTKYEASYKLVPLLLYGTISWGMVGVVAIACEIGKKSYHITVATVLGAVATILLNGIFIPRWGLLGAAATAMLGNVLALVYVYRAGQAYFFVEYELPRMFKVFGLASLAILCGNFVDAYHPTWSLEVLPWKLVVFSVFMVGLIVWRALTPDEIRSVWAIVRQRVGWKVSQQ